MSILRLILVIKENKNMRPKTERITFGSDSLSMGNHEFKRNSRLRVASLFTMLVSCMLLTLTNASCSLPQDYRNLIGAAEADVEPAYSAPNDLGDLAVAGTYYTIQAKVVGYVYLWQESDCSYLWKYQFDEIKYLYAAAWSQDQRSSVYVLGYNKLIYAESHFITVFHDPYNDSIFGMGAPFTYKISLPYSLIWAPILENGAGVFGLPTDGLTQHSRLARALIISHNQMQVLTVGVGSKGAIAQEIQVSDNDRILHATLNASGEKLFTLTANNMNNSVMKVRKFDIGTMAQNGAEMDFFAHWSDNDNFTNEGYGRIGVHQSGTTDTLFVGTSQIGGHTGVHHQILENHHYDSVELVRLTFIDDNQACVASSNCVRYALSTWRKVLAIAPTSATTAHFLLAVPHISFIGTLTGDLEIQILTVDFSTETYNKVSQTSQFTTFNFYSTQDVFDFFGTYDLPHLVARPYYGAPGSTTLEDFYLTICLEGLPGSTWDLDSGKRVTTTLTLLNDRVTDFFEAATSAALPSGLTLTLISETVSHHPLSVEHRQVVRMFNDGVSQTNKLVNFDAIAGEQQITGHSLVPAERTVKLNNAPIFSYTDIFVTIGVGQYLTAPFIYTEWEDNTPLSLVSLEYSDNPGNRMPEPASDFYYVDPQNESLQSLPYRLEHVGQHQLNVTVSDSEGAQVSTLIGVNVQIDEVPDDEIITATETSEDILLNEITSLKAFFEEKGDDAFDSIDELTDDEDDEELPYCDEIHNTPPKNGGGHKGDGKAGDGKAGGGHAGGGPAGSGKAEGGNSQPAEGGHHSPGKRRMFLCRHREESTEDEVQEDDVAETAAAFVFDASQYHLTNGCISEQGCKSEEKNETIEISDVEVTTDGTVTIKFTSDITFLRKLCESINECTSITPTRKLQQSTNAKDQWSSLVANIEISLVRDSIVQDNVEFQWNIVEVGHDYMKIKVTWTDPAEVSSGDSVDQLYLKIDARSLNIKSFASVFEYTASVPKQAEEQVELVEEEKGIPASVVSGLATTAATSIFRLIMVGALSQLWGLINGLSLFVHLPLLAPDGLAGKHKNLNHDDDVDHEKESDSETEDVDEDEDQGGKNTDYNHDEVMFDQQGISIPESTLDILGYLITVAQFDIVENEVVYGSYVPFEPENDDLQRNNFYLTGYESNYAMVNMGTNLLILPIVFFIIFLLFICLPIRNSKSWSGRKHRKCSKDIFWNFWLRLLIQGCLEILCAAGPYLMDRKELLERSENGYTSYFILNDILSISLTAVLFAMPIWVLIFYCCNFEKLSDEKFNEKWGSAYDGLNPKKRSSIFYPVYFLVRRILFLTFILAWKDSTSLKIFANILMTMIAAIYLIVYKPFASKLLQGLEVFNEFTSLVLLSLVLGWTNFGLQEREKEIVGFVFNSCMGVNISVHLFFLLRTVCRDCSKKCEKKKKEKNVDKQVNADKTAAEATDKLAKKKRPGQSQPDFINEPDRAVRRQQIMKMCMSQISEEEESEHQESSERSPVNEGSSPAVHQSAKKLLIDMSGEMIQRLQQPRPSPITQKNTINELQDRAASNRNIPVRKQIVPPTNNAPELFIQCEQTENRPARYRQNDRTNMDPEPEPELLYAVKEEVDDHDIFVADADEQEVPAASEQKRRQIVAKGPIGARLLANEDEHESENYRLQVPGQIQTRPGQEGLVDDFDIQDAYESFVVNSIAGSSNINHQSQET